MLRQRLAMTTNWLHQLPFAGCNKRSQLVNMLLEAEACQLDELRNSCLLRLAHNVAEWGPDLVFSLTQASLLQRCGARTLAQLLGMVAAAGAQPRKAREQLAGMLPSAADLEPALQAAANPGQFLWTIEKFSEQPSEVGACVKSPEFTAAGVLNACTGCALNKAFALGLCPH